MTPEERQMRCALLHSLVRADYNAMSTDDLIAMHALLVKAGAFPPPPEFPTVNA